MTDESTEILVAGERQYPVIVGRGLRFDLARHLGTGVSKVLIVHAPTLGAAAAELRESLLGQYEVLLAEVPDAEAAKRIEVASFLWQIMGQADFTRSDAVVGFEHGDLVAGVQVVGGGETGDARPDDGDAHDVPSARRLTRGLRRWTEGRMTAGRASG